MKAFPFWVGLRYTRSSNQQKFLSLLSWLSLIGMMLGVSALIIVMSVMKGFQKELQTRLLSVSAEVVIESTNNQTFNPDFMPILLSGINNDYPDLEYQGFIGGDVVVQYADSAQAINLTGLPSDAIQTLLLKNHQLLDVLPRYSIVIGDVLSRRLAIEQGDKLKIILPQLVITPFSAKPRQREFTVAGVFSSGSDIDGNTAFIPIEAARRLYKVKAGHVHGIEFFGVSQDDNQLGVKTFVFTEQIQQQLKRLNKENLTAVPWQKKQQQLYRAVKMEQFMIGFMLSLVIGVAAFNLIALLSMMVAAKQSDIAVLQMMGMSPGQAMLIFLTQGMILALLSTLVGVVSGVLVALNISSIVSWLEGVLGFYIFDPSVFYITGLPSHLQWSDVVYVTCFTLLMSVLFCLYPAWRASKIKPVDALSYY